MRLTINIEGHKSDHDDYGGGWATLFLKIRCEATSPKAAKKEIRRVFKLIHPSHHSRISTTRCRIKKISMKITLKQPSKKFRIISTQGAEQWSSGVLFGSSFTTTEAELKKKHLRWRNIPKKVYSN